MQSAPARTLPDGLRLPNGLRLVGVARPGSPLGAVLLRIQVGSADEEVGEEGLAHVLEHLVVRCAMNGGRVGDGALVTARTGKESTLYSVIARSEAIRQAIDILGTAFTELRVPADVLDAELAAIREECRHRAHDPAWRLQESLLSALWAGTRCAHPVLGEARTIDTLSSRQIRDFHAAWYRPAHATLAVAADNLASLLPAVAEAASVWSGRPALPRPGHPKVGPAAGSPVERPGTVSAIVTKGPVSGLAFAERRAWGAAPMLACDAVKAAGGLTVQALPVRGWLCVWAMLTASETEAARASVVGALAAACERLAGSGAAAWLRTDVLIPRLRAEDDIDMVAERAADPRTVIREDDLVRCPAEDVGGALGEWRRRFSSASVEGPADTGVRGAGEGP